jgi:ketosteroid isomerase-like protein
MTTRQTLELYFERLQRKADWDALLADNMVFTSFTIPNKQVSGKDAYLRATKGFYSMIRRAEVRQLIIDGGAACALTRYDLQPPNGPVFQSDVAEVFSVSNGKIDSLGIYFDPTPFPK